MDASYFVARALSQGAFEFPTDGRKLRSGRESPYFFNIGRFATASALEMVGEAYAHVIRSMMTDDNRTHPDVIYGPAYKGIVLAAATAMSLGRTFYPLRDKIGYAFNRKEKKAHGEGGVLVGMPLAGKRVVIIDDVMTTGGSGDEAIALVKRGGGTPIAYVVGFDREESDAATGMSAGEAFRTRHGIPVRSVSSVRDLMLFLERNPEFPRGTDALRRIREYQSLYGA